jgi:hypothetical protein
MWSAFQAEGCALRAADVSWQGSTGRARPDHAREPDRRCASVTCGCQCIEQRRHQRGEASLHGAFEQHQSRIAEKRTRASCAGEIAGGEIAGTHQWQSWQTEGAAKSGGVLAKLTRIIPGVMELLQKDVGGYI